MYNDVVVQMSFVIRGSVIWNSCVSDIYITNYPYNCLSHGINYVYLLITQKHLQFL